MTLREGKIEKVYEIEIIKVDKGMKDRLEILGFTQGARLKLLHCNISGAVVVMIRGTRIGLGKKIVQSIYIREV